MPSDVRRNYRGASEARMLAVQALYQRDLTGATADSVVAEFVQHRLHVERHAPGHAEPALHNRRRRRKSLVRSRGSQYNQVDVGGGHLRLAKRRLGRVQRQIRR